MNGTGTENGYFQSFGTFDYSGGTFNGTLENDSTASITNPFRAGAGIINNTLITLGTNGNLYGGGAIGLDNEGEIDIAGNTIGGTSTLNDGAINGYGTINGANFTNYGLVTQGAGSLTLSATGTNQNFGNINLAAGRQFRLTGGTLTNEGSLTLGGGIVAGTSTLDNSVGGVITGPGSILAPFSNQVGGTIQETAGTLNVSHAFTNSGLISLGGATANLTGPGISNVGTIQGVGNIGSTSLTNDGIIEAIGGTLGVNGTLSNQTDGQILAGTGGKVLVSNGLAINAGLINLTGGTYDNNNHAMDNTGQISGYGTLRTGGLTNDGSVTFTGGTTTVNGNVTNSVGKTITVAQTPATFTGNVTNNGTFRTTNTTATFTGSFTNNGLYASDPSTQTFQQNFTTTPTGSVQASPGDIYKIDADVINNSTQKLTFDMSQAKIEIDGSGNHNFTWTGVDKGAVPAGYTNNFAIGTLELTLGSTLTLLNGIGDTGSNSGTATAGAALYVGTLTLDGITSSNTSEISTLIVGNGMDIYYNSSLNTYLDGKTYALSNGGFLEAVEVPEPSTFASMLIGLGLLWFASRARKTEISL
jgi:hypothetical protein